MRIGVVTTSYPRFDGDAAGSFVAAHVAALRGGGHDVEVISAQSIAGGGAASGANRGGLFDGAGAPDELERGRLRLYLDAARFTTAMTATVLRRARHWELTMAHWLAPSALAALPSRGPLLAIAHGGDIHTLRRLRLLAPALYLLRARGARLSFVTEELRSIARAAAPGLGRYVDDAIVQPMGIDVARFAALGRRENLATDARPPHARAVDRRHSILVVARLVPVKGVDVALEAFRRLSTRADLVIAGDGPERARLAALATTATPATTATTATTAPTVTTPTTATTAATATRAVRFLGAVDAATRDELLREADLVVIPSRVLPNGRSEGSPMIALEALAAGVPVVASAVGGLRDLPGITLVPPDDPGALAAAIDRMLAAPPSPVDVSHLDWHQVSARLLHHATIS